MYVYQQSTGDLQRDGEHLGICYSGHGAGLNNPDLEHVHNYGPIPKGIYTIGPAFRHNTKGAVCMRLIPDGHDACGRAIPLAEDAQGRDGFLIHGDNKLMNHTASEGCIIASLTIRQDIAQSKDRELLVIA
jgi:hypothetical protein